MTANSESPASPADPAQDAPPRWWDCLWARYLEFALAPLRVLASTFGLMLFIAIGLIVIGMQLYTPATFSLDDQPVGGPVVQPPDFTPVASAPVAFDPVTPDVATVAPTAESDSTAVPTPTERASPEPVDPLESNAARSTLAEDGRYLAVLLLGADSRPDEGELSRSDTLMVAVLDLVDPRATVISVPRDLWVPIPGYGYSRINTAYFFGVSYGEGGAELARRTVSGVLDIPISHTITVDFNGFRTLIDEIGGIDIYVPKTIEDWAYPDDSYGTMYLYIEEGQQHMDGNLALMYARTRHADSDLHRAARQQDVIRAVRNKLLQATEVPNWPRYIRLAAREIDTTLSLSDLFFLARYARSLEDEDISMHVIEPPLLWEGFTGDGQQVLLYNPTSLQLQVHEWLEPSSAVSNMPQGD